MIVAIVPAYNEEKTIYHIVKKTRRYADKTIVVDDSSIDRTATFANKGGAFVISHKNNFGVGSSTRDGFRKAIELTKKDNDIIITLDADGQHDPDDIPKFVEKIQSGYDFVLGCRDLSKYPLEKRIGNKILNYLTNAITGTKLMDTESGFRGYTRKTLKKLKLKANRYEVCAEIIYEIGRNKLKSANTMISSPIYVKGTGVLDGVRNFLFLLKKRLSV